MSSGPDYFDVGNGVKGDVTAWLPTKPPVPAPFILTAEQVVQMLCLDTNGLKRGLIALEHYRRTGRLKGTRLGRYIRYRLPDVLEFTAKQKES